MSEKPIFEAEFTQGLEEFAYQELRKAGAKFIKSEFDQAGVIRFKFGKSQTRLGNLRVVSRLFQVHKFGVPRPKALLGQQHFDRLQTILKNHVADMGGKRVKSFRLEAAGKESAAFQRLITQIESMLKLPHDSVGGDLFIRVKPAVGKNNGWELLVRPTLRPLAARPWRVFNYPGALSAPIAAAMLDMAEILPTDNVLNVMCGSATFQAEFAGSCQLWANCDLNHSALAGARLNVQATGRDGNFQQANGMSLPYQDASFDILLSDLPWGQLIGESVDMTQLYTQTLSECGRVAKPGAKLLVITQLKKRFLQSVERSPWVLMQTIQLKHEKVSPVIYQLTLGR